MPSWNKSRISAECQQNLFSSEQVFGMRLLPVISLGELKGEDKQLRDIK